MRPSTVGELITRLKTFNPDLPVAIACQPGWPLQYVITDLREFDGYKLYLVQGEDAEYLSDLERQAIGW